MLTLEELLALVDGFLAGWLAAIKRAEKAEAKLWKYGRHYDTCRVYCTDRSGPCSCGLDNGGQQHSRKGGSTREMNEPLWWLHRLFSTVVRNQLEARLGLQRIEERLDVLMALADDLKAGIKKLDDETTAIGAVIAGLVTKLQAGNLSPAEQADIFTALNAVGARLTTLGVDPTSPVPPPTPPLQAARALAGVP